MSNVSNESQAHSRSSHSHTQEGDPGELHRNLEKASNVIHHFIKSVDQEVQAVMRYHEEIEQLNATSEVETCALSLQFIQEVISSYRNFQYKLSKSRQSSKGKGDKQGESPAAATLKQAKSFKNPMGSTMSGASASGLQKAGSSSNLTGGDPFNMF